MRTEIIYSYILRDGYYISAVLPLNDNQTAVFTYKYGESSFLDIINLERIIITIDLSKLPGIDSINHNKCYFNTGSKFGLVQDAEVLYLFDISDFDNYEIVKISNPFKPDEYHRKTNVESASTYLINKKLLFGLADYFCNGYPARYLNYLEIMETSGFLGFGKKKIVAKWNKMNELSKKYFPETMFGKYNDDNDWLNIRALTQIENNIFVHTTGGASTRLKSGNSFEFNIIAKFDKEFNWIKNFEIERGFGRFSTDKKYFIQHPSKYRNKLFFYSTDKIEVEFEISLTSKQNLYQEKASQIQADILKDKIFIYNNKFLNICKPTD